MHGCNCRAHLDRWALLYVFLHMACFCFWSWESFQSAKTGKKNKQKNLRVDFAVRPCYPLKVCWLRKGSTLGSWWIRLRAKMAGLLILMQHDAQTIEAKKKKYKNRLGGLDPGHVVPRGSCGPQWWGPMSQIPKSLAVWVGGCRSRRFPLGGAVSPGQSGSRSNREDGSSHISHAGKDASNLNLTA